MKQRLPLVLSITALTVALFGSTPIGHAVTSVVPPFAKKAGYAKTAGNAAAVNGIKAARTPKPGFLVPLGADAKLPASVGQVGPAGPNGDKGDTGSQGAKGGTGPKGDKGDKGSKGDPGPAGPPGISGYQVVEKGNTTTAPLFTITVTVPCPPGKKVLGGGSYNSVEMVSSRPTDGGTSWTSTSRYLSTGTNTLVGYAICANVVS